MCESFVFEEHKKSDFGFVDKKESKQLEKERRFVCVLEGGGDTTPPPFYHYRLGEKFSQREKETECVYICVYVCVCVCV